MSLCRDDEEGAECLVSIGEGAGDADWGLLQTATTKANAALGASFRDGETVDVPAAVAESDHTLVHGMLEHSHRLTLKSVARISRSYSARAEPHLLPRANVALGDQSDWPIGFQRACSHGYRRKQSEYKRILIPVVLEVVVL